jgi:hypothetical protein
MVYPDTVTTFDVLSNDYAPGSALTLAGYFNLTAGSVSITTNYIIYTAAGSPGAASFSYYATNAFSQSVTGTVSVSVSLAGLIPVMTSDSAPSGQASGAGWGYLDNQIVWINAYAYAAFSGGTQHGQYLYITAGPAYLIYQFPTSKVVTNFYAMSYGDYGNQVVLQGSNDGVTYTPIGNNPYTLNVCINDVFVNTNAYSYYKFICTNTMGGFAGFRAIQLR